MNDLGPVPAGRFSHDLLLYDRDDDFVREIGDFAELGLESGGQVFLHSTTHRVDMLRDSLGPRERLVYAADGGPFPGPSSVLWAFQRLLAARPEADVWTAGTVPVGADGAVHPAWARYESLANVALGGYAFHALCTFDTRTLSDADVAAARATHPCVSEDGVRRANPGYRETTTFLTDPLAAPPSAPASQADVTEVLERPGDLNRARRSVAHRAAYSAVPPDRVEAFVTAANEVLTNGLVHGGPPVVLELWVELSRLTCRVVDAGPGIDDPLAGARHPGSSGPKGLWLARQTCDEVVVTNSPDGGCSVLLFTRAQQ